MEQASRIDEVISFWFADPARWWRKDPSFDEEIRARFAALHAALERDELEDWKRTPRGTLAYVIVLDQFSRNMFRDTPRMFASDARARAAVHEAIARCDDVALSSVERGFLYMPLMHSEKLAEQEQSVALYGALDTGQLSFARQHRDIVERFGRFPHRNAILGRASTPEELAFLEQPGSSF
jgi:uncharacterized protein (DUF924 family)